MPVPCEIAKSISKDTEIGVLGSISLLLVKIAPGLGQSEGPRNQRYRLVKEQVGSS